MLILMDQPLNMNRRAHESALTREALEARKARVDHELRTATAWRRSALLRERAAIKEALCSTASATVSKP